MSLKRLLFILFLTLIYMSVIAQEATVPDLTGLTVPQAAAALNEVGLGIGNEEAVEPAAGNGTETGKISSQSAEAGTSVTAGTLVDIGVVHNNNVRLIYDDNDITLFNTTNNVADITGVRFVAVEGDSPAQFAATRWASNVREERCLQLWSISVRDSKPVSGCKDISWLTTNNTGEHFWTQANGVQKFAVVENGIERARCDAAAVGSQPITCDFYLAGAGSADDLTTYIRFEYTADAITISNPTTDKWMPTDRTVISSANLTMGDPAIFENPEIVADITQLAPGQCIMLTASDGAPPPLPCTVIAQHAASAFWQSEFELTSANDGKTHTCPAASTERLTICIVPQ